MSDQNLPPIPPQQPSSNEPPTLGTPPTPPAPPAGPNPWESVAGDAAQSLGNTLSGVTEPGFFAALFDFSFSKFITQKVLGVLYALLAVVLVLTYVGAVIAAFVANAGLGIAVLILGPIVALIYLIFARITLEFYAAAIRTAQNTGTLVGQGGVKR